KVKEINDRWRLDGTTRILPVLKMRFDPELAKLKAYEPIQLRDLGLDGNRGESDEEKLLRLLRKDQRTREEAVDLRNLHELLEQKLRKPPTAEETSKQAKAREERERELAQKRKNEKHNATSREEEIKELRKEFGDEIREKKLVHGSGFSLDPTYDYDGL